jgi:hypothetical protein
MNRFFPFRVFAISSRPPPFAGRTVQAGRHEVADGKSLTHGRLGESRADRAVKKSGSAGEGEPVSAGISDSLP